MEVGVGLPGVVPGCDGALLVDWARAADDGPFASVAVVDRLRYDNYDPLVALSAAAAVTTRVQLATSILISPLRGAATLAKQVLSLDALSGGRLVLGLAVGARRDDYEAAGQPWPGRGDVLDDQLAALRAVVEEGVIGPVRPRVPPVLMGGGSGAALARMARGTDGYIHGGGPPRAFARAADQARAAWADAGRPGTPRLHAMAYYALGGAGDAGRDHLLDYYAFTGPFVRRIADGLLTSPAAVRAFVTGYADAGCDHLLLFPTVADRRQLDLLAAALP